MNLCCLQQNFCLGPDSAFKKLNSFFDCFQMVDLQRKEKDVKRLMDEAITLAQKVVDGKMHKQTYVDQDEANAEKREKLSQEIENIQESL